MSDTHYPALSDIDAIQQAFESAGYICTTRIATVVRLAAALEKPVLIEGPPGVGKTELAKTCAMVVDRPLVRLQCYEGLDESKALYEWKYGKQLLYTQLLKEQLGDVLDGAKGLNESMSRLHEFGDVFYSEAFLESRPLLKAMEADNGGVLLIDEIDKADFEFESLLLEVLSDFQVSIPELGTIQAHSKPLVFLTSNDTRDSVRCAKAAVSASAHPFPFRRAGGANCRQPGTGSRAIHDRSTGALCACHPLTGSQKSAGHLGDRGLGQKSGVAPC